MGGAALGMEIGSIYGGKAGAAMGGAAGLAAAGGLMRWPRAREAMFRFIRGPTRDK
jgi:hypothetical protein